MTGVLQKPLMNYLSVAPPSRILLFEDNNNSVTVEFGVRRGGGDLLVEVRWDGDEAAIISASTSHYIILVNEFSSLSNLKDIRHET